MDRFEKKRKSPKPQNVIFRRFRTLPNGKVLDAHDYGLKAWPIYLKSKRSS